MVDAYVLCPPTLNGAIQKGRWDSYFRLLNMWHIPVLRVTLDGAIVGSLVFAAGVYVGWLELRKELGRAHI